MEFSQLLNLILHIDKSLGSLLVDYGPLVYGLLFGIVFAETGLVIFPFLPGDTLVFMAGAFCATGAMHTGLLIFLLVLAAVTGNTVNYYVGRAIGQKAYSHNYRWLDRNALEKTHAFFEAHGGKTVMLARWLPVVRTFAPFVAGISGMSAGRFQLYNMQTAAADTSDDYLYACCDSIDALQRWRCGTAPKESICNSLWDFKSWELRTSPLKI